MSTAPNQPAAPLAPATVAVTAGRPPRAQGGHVNPSIPMNSTYVSRGVVTSDELSYARGDNDAWHAFEAALGELEGGTGVLFSSGMAAIAASFALVPDGGTLVLPRHAYQAGLVLARQVAERHGVTLRYVDIADTDAVVAALDGADLLLAESPTNPMLEVADLPAVLGAARAAGVPSVVDNTFATPLGQRPLDHGADVVLHSVTKYLAGHSDVVLGAVVTRDADLLARFRDHRTLHGAIAGAFEAWLALRGLRTLALRFERAQANAAELARRLAEHPDVAEVRHPSLPGDPGHERARAQMTGFGAILGVRPAARPGTSAAERADAVVDAVRLWLPATSLGGVESMLERRRRWGTETTTVPEDLLRLSVGIEDVEDLWADLDRALRA
ncbi:trans-sulfuration enzyme family protein [Promicromonospora citrea]|uniref:homocysteine desulfhydrase n=1 Tax=Promicromonospora citrea TaxID=43677 RepID=A0A8H9GEF1_9MICO|nr:aminotransferase class I/II-fold pyridoxal phosphate-dependent enzyme [Promicromonospora citrea]NNH54437.1 aminotransferase class I/II-fold pyridoxal phosphate-dependent enzyme [Promicromonospora citrea]GGM15713.1 cystathionine gamma-synthase [Promicromonospora citrea]